SMQGSAVALSGTGRVLIEGGPADGGGSQPTSASAIFARNGADWQQQGSKLVGTGSITGQFGVWQGNAVGISGDGHTAIVGGRRDNTEVGAVWIFVDTPP